MPNLNRVQLIGNIGNDPEMKYTPSGKPVTSFSLATNRKYTKEDGTQVKETEWFNIITWNKLAERCNQYLHKGSSIYLEGRLHTRQWESQSESNETIKHQRTEVICNNFIFLDKKTVDQPIITDEETGEDIPL